MPDFEFTSPEGKKYTVSGPEGATKEQAFGILQKQISSGSANYAKPQTDVSSKEQINPTTSQTDSILARNPLMETAMNIGSSMIAKPIGEIASLAALAKEKISPTGVDFSKANPRKFGEEVQRSLTYQPRSPVAQAIQKYNPLQVPGMITDYVGRKTSDVIRGDADVDSLRGRIGSGVREAINQTPNVLLPTYAEEQKAKVPERQARLDVLREQNAPKDLIRNQSQQAGLITPVEGHSIIPGINKVNEFTSDANAAKMTKLVKEEVGIPENKPLTAETLKEIRDANGGAYQKIIDEGNKITHNILSESKVIPPKIRRDSLGNPVEVEPGKTIPSKTETKGGFKISDEVKKPLLDAYDTLVNEIKESPETFKYRAPTLRLLKEYIKKDVMTPESTIEAIKQLRADATADFKAHATTGSPGKLSSAMTRQEIARMLESSIDENLGKTAEGKAFLSDMKAARKKIAQTYVLENAIDEAGNVNAAKLHAMDKGQLSGNLKLISQFYDQFPEVAKMPKNAKAPLKVFDYILAGTGHLGLAATDLAARAAVPMLSEKGLFQSRTPSYKAAPPGLARVATPAAIGIAGTRNQKQDDQ